MIKIIEKMLVDGEVSVKIDGKQRVIKAEDMPVMMEFYHIVKALGFNISAIQPLLVMQGYNNGKPCSVENILQTFKRGNDPVQIVGKMTLYNVIDEFTGLLKLLIKQGKFEGDYPTKGSEATAFIKNSISSI